GNGSKVSQEQEHAKSPARQLPPSPSEEQDTFHGQDNRTDNSHHCPDQQRSCRRQKWYRWHRPPLARQYTALVSACSLSFSEALRPPLKQRRGTREITTGV